MAATQPLCTPGARGGASCATYYRLSITAKVAPPERLRAGICLALMWRAHAPGPRTSLSALPLRPVSGAWSRLPIARRMDWGIKQCQQSFRLG